MQTLFAIAVAIGFLSALMGNRTAAALVGSALFCTVIGWFGLEFSTPAWFVIDGVVICFIVRCHMPLADWFILALFPIAWGLYFSDEYTRYWGVLSVVIAQLLMTTPLTKLQKIGGSVSHGPLREVQNGKRA